MDTGTVSETLDIDVADRRENLIEYRFFVCVFCMLTDFWDSWYSFAWAAVKPGSQRKIFWEAVGLERGPLSLVSTREYNWGATWKK
jgi:hypothetical protein